MSKECICPDCGYTWQQGQHGGHSCATVMKKTIESQAREIERLHKDYDEACEDAMAVARQLAALICNMAAIAVYVCHDEARAYLDSLPECCVGLCAAAPSPSREGE